MKTTLKRLIITLLVIGSYCIWSVNAFHPVKLQIQQKRYSTSRWRRTTISFSNQDEILRTSVLLNEGAEAVAASSDGRNWFLRLVDRIPIPDMSASDLDSDKIDLIGSIIGFELIVLGVLTALLAIVTIVEKVYEYRLDEGLRDLDLNWSVQNNGAKSRLREALQMIEYWPEDDIRYRRDLIRRLGRDPFTDSTAMLEGEGEANPVPRSSTSNPNPSGLNRKMRRLEKYRKK